MNVLYHFRTRGVGAEAVHIAGVANALERLGHTVSFVSPSGADPRQTAGENPFAAGGGAREPGGFAGRLASFAFELLEIGYNAVAGWRLRREVHRLRPAFVYERHAFFLCAGALLCARRGVPRVVEVNELVGDERVRSQPLLAPLARWCDRLSLGRASLVVVVSPHLARRAVEAGADPARVLVLPNAVDPGPPGEAGACAAVREELGIPPGATTIGFVGWFVAWHRLDRLVAATAALRAEHPERDLHLLLIGDGPLREELKAQAQTLGLAEAVHFSGAVPHAAIPAHIGACDIAVVPASNAYRSPIKLFEYMAQARAVVAPATEPVREVIEDGVNGFLFDDDPDLPPPAGESHLRAALARAFDPALRSRLGERARADVLAKHTWDANAEKILARLRK